MRVRDCVFLVLLVLIVSSGYAQEDDPEGLIVAIPFDTIPDGTSLIGAGGITLDGNVTATQDLTAQGMIEAQAVGYKFPDGTIQTTAAFSVGSTANAGLYDNRIINGTPPLPYSEICFKEGGVMADIHAISESTAGGNCLPGDLGWIVERNQRSAANWEAARAQCLLDGMRLPEPFEWFYSCNDAATYGINGMVGDWEWSSNSAFPQTSAAFAVAVLVAGLSSCEHGTWGSVAQSNGNSGNFTYRCLR